MDQQEASSLPSGKYWVFSMLSTYNHCKYNLQNPVCNIKQDLILSQNKIRMLVV